VGSPEFKPWSHQKEKAKKLKVRLSHDPAITLPDMHPKESVNKDSYIHNSPYSRKELTIVKMTILVNLIYIFSAQYQSKSLKLLFRY
jgi:hypothetical protein